MIYWESTNLIDSDYPRVHYETRLPRVQESHSISCLYDLHSSFIGSLRWRCGQQCNHSHLLRYKCGKRVPWLHTVMTFHEAAREFLYIMSTPNFSFVPSKSFLAKRGSERRQIFNSVSQQIFNHSSLSSRHYVFV